MKSTWCLCAATLLVQVVIPITTVSAAKTYHVQGDVRVSFLGALQLCAREDKQLATVNSAEEQKDLEKAIRSSHVSKSRFWIGGMDAGQKGSFVWLSTGKSFVYTNWWSTEPNNYDGKQDCVCVWPNGSGKYEWADYFCSEYFYFVCENKPTTQIVNIVI